MAAQTFVQRERKSVPKMNEVVAQYEAEQHEAQMRKARKAVKRAHALVQEAERFLAS